MRNGVLYLIAYAVIIGLAIAGPLALLIAVFI